MSILIEHSKGKNVTYVIDTEKKTVKAMLRTDKCEPEKAFQKAFLRAATQSGVVSVRPLDFFDPTFEIGCRYVGIARCHENDHDKFDIEFGKKLALARAKKKHNNAYASMLNSMTCFVETFAEELNDRCNDIWSKHQSATDEEQTLLEQTP